MIELHHFESSTIKDDSPVNRLSSEEYSPLNFQPTYEHDEVSIDEADGPINS